MLANKYRPIHFNDMIGQEVLVTTLSNAIKNNRIANAFLLTGIRGVGKTTTARIIARALNCTGSSTPESATIDPCGTCSNCVSIGQSRHPDVLEVDAASRTGVDDMREIIDNVHYVPAMARYKIYIIDEVHMLSKSAFNALLKTLEEPPAHVKFIFATTEIRKIPVTILSRCQRFDLKRIDVATLSNHLKHIAVKEEVAVEDEALHLIAKAAEGSVRDALSILDQAIVHADGEVTSALISKMIGISDKHQLIDLFETAAKGDVVPTLEHYNTLYHHGADVTQLFEDMLELVHTVSKAKLVPGMTTPLHLAEDHFKRIKDIAAQLDLSYLTRCWQLLINGLEELRKAPIDVIAGEMLLIKLMHMSQLPSPAKIIRQLQDGSIAPSVPATSTQHVPAEQAIHVPAHASNGRQHNTAPAYLPETMYALEPETSTMPQNFETLVALFKANKEPLLHGWLYNEVHLIKFAPGRLELRLSDTLPTNFVQRVSGALQEWTGTRWVITISKEQGEPTLREQYALAKKNLLLRYTSHPEVAQVLELFKGAYVKEVV